MGSWSTGGAILHWPIAHDLHNSDTDTLNVSPYADYKKIMSSTSIMSPVPENLGFRSEEDPRSRRD